MNTHLTAIEKQSNLVSNDLIIFSHIPKTAGSTINEIIEANYTQDSIFSFYSQKQSENTTVKDWVDRFNQENKPLDRQSNSKILRGHFGLGLHEFLRTNSCTYISVLRHPIDRVISHYYYFARPESNSKLVTEDMTLETFIKAKRYIIADNYQTRFLSGMGWQRGSYGNHVYDRKYQIRYGNCTEKMLEVAKNNLDKYVLFGLQNRFADSLNLFRNVLNWQQVNFDTQKNVNNKKPKKDTIEPELLRLIEEANKLDLELYEYAEKTFDNQLKNLQLAPKIVDNKLSWLYPDFPQRNNRKKQNNRSSQMTLELEQKSKSNEKAKSQLIEADKLFEAGDYNGAIDKYKEIIKDNPEYIAALNKLASSYNKINAEDQAVKVFKHIIGLKPEKDSTRLRLAKLLAKQGKNLEASQQYKKAISINFDQPDSVFIALGKALKQVNKDSKEEL